MCRLKEELLGVRQGLLDDAVVILTGPVGENTPIDYNKAVGVVHRVFTGDPSRSWSFNPLMKLGDTILPGASVFGDMDDAVSAVQYQFGTDISMFNFARINYCDPSFPSHLVI